ncbi:MAG: L-threonine 3-dehydrogenase [Chloroflexi bacterium]|nr:MAG: L-threonine 3-dehydrogenase [Chloroflexota bacterium]RPI96104.1 MAG: L-threonine 3-dehydrogenase [Chloroflexota bacterium]
MKTVVIQRPNEISVLEQAVPEPGPWELMIQVMASGICGTDLHIYRGEYMGNYPVIPGHEFSGVVTGIGSQITRFKVGDRVAVEPNIACDNCVNCLNNRQNFCLNWQAVGVTLPGGMEEYVIVPEKAAFNIGELPFEVGAFMEPLSCVVHGIERAHIGLADHVAILGAGPIGILMIQMARIQGAAHITILEINPGRADLARQFGADRVVNSFEDLQPDTYDVVIDATGAIPVMNRSIDFARKGGTVLLFGVPPTGRNIEMEGFKIFQKGLTMLSSFTSVRNSFQAVDLLQSGQIKVDALISHRLPLQELPRALELIESRDPAVKKVIVQPNG